MSGFFDRPRLLLAPMAGVSDEVFRLLACEHGADLAYTEMVSAKGLSYANERTRRLLNLGEGESRVAVQLFGHEPATMAAQAAWVEETLGESLAYLDINMGCPARKIVTKGDGCALMTDPSLAARVVSAVAGAASRPVAVKFRRGYAVGDETCVDFARRMEDAGAFALTVHGRFAGQMYRGRSERGAIARVKRAVSVPVVGNGDVTCGADAASLMAETGCDAVMIARGAQGNPWVFAQARAVLEGRPEPLAPTVAERIAMAERHARLMAERCPEALVRMRRHAMWYVAGVPGATAARGRFNYCLRLTDFLDAFEALREAADAHGCLDDRPARRG
ncbi:tRNA dihydrouridine synthase DusB [Eggerthellaceae bacterium zg-997]|nr:tRNA dihydrouridine synthase DusB [Eggerthellaceae bacterium zg-997]